MTVELERDLNLQTLQRLEEDPSAAPKTVCGS